jgi:hypothetical protein
MKKFPYNPIADRKTVETLIGKKEFYKSLPFKKIPYSVTVFEEDIQDCTKDSSISPSQFI